MQVDENNRILVYDVDRHAHLRVKKNEFFYITREIFKIEKFSIDIALNDICPKNKEMWGELKTKAFPNFVKNQKFIFI